MQNVQSVADLERRMLVKILYVVEENDMPR